MYKRAKFERTISNKKITSISSVVCSYKQPNGKINKLWVVHWLLTCCLTFFGRATDIVLIRSFSSYRMNTNSYCIFVTICFANCITALPIGTEVHVHGHTFPKIERIIVHVQKRMADIWDFWQLNRSKFNILNWIVRHLFNIVRILWAYFFLSNIYAIITNQINFIINFYLNFSCIIDFGNTLKHLSNNI